ncbi:MAG: biotin--[acetyl-CoA-carboxylase] ligase [Planctomycetota bacterium]
MLNASAIQAALGQARLGREIRALGSITSTSDIAWAWADAGCDEGLTVFADQQIRGRGRFGRSWHCPRGRGVLVSVVLRPPEGIGPEHLTAVGALAVAETAEAVAELPARIRWPNDVTVGGRKLAGVLVERRGRAAAPAVCVVGIGLNVNLTPGELPAAVGPATSLSAEGGQEFVLERVAATLLRRLDARYYETCGSQWRDVAEAWRARCGLVGEVAEVEVNGQRLRGTVTALDPLAGLDLMLEGGGRRRCGAEAATVVQAAQAVKRG